jgi:ABC-2 type transport system permease protein
MNWKKIWAVIKKEYITRVRTKAFIIGTILGPVAFAAMIVVPVLLTGMQGNEQRKIAIADFTGECFDLVKGYLTSGNQKIYYHLEEVKIGNQSIESVKEQLKRRVLNKNIDAYILIGKGFLEGDRPEYHSKHVSNFRELKLFEDALTKAAIQKRLEKEGLEPNKVDAITKNVDLKVIKVAEKGKEQEEKGQTFFFSYVLLIMLYTTVLLYGVSIMRSVIEDKNSRMVEVLASSIKPMDLMFGKLIGVGAVGLTQYLIWSAIAVLILIYGASIALFMNPSVVIKALPVIQVSIFIYFILFFLLGYFLYSTLYVIVGSMVDNEQDAQNVQMPIIIFLVIPMMIAPLILSSPDSTLSVVLSLIPLLTPIIMFLRITMLTPPFYQIATSIILTLLTIVFLVWIAARIYKVGMLIYGKKVSLPEIIKWARSK